MSLALHPEQRALDLAIDAYLAVQEEFVNAAVETYTEAFKIMPSCGVPETLAYWKHARSFLKFLRHNVGRSCDQYELTER